MISFEERRWLSAMPLSLRPLWELMNDFWDDLSIFHDALWKNNDDVQETARALFFWYGSGKGPWSGYPMYERVPELLLLEIPTSDLVTALQSTILTVQHLEGGARYFTGGYFLQYRINEGDTLPPSLLDTLAAHVFTSGDQDKIRRYQYFVSHIAQS